MIEDAAQCGRSLLFWSLDVGVPGVGLLPLLMIVMARFCHLLDSLPLIMGEQVVGRMSCLPLVRRADHRPCPVSEVCWSCLPLVVPVGAKAPATLVGVGLQNQRRLSLQRHEFESRCDSTLPYPSPVLGMATAVWNLPTPAPDGLVTWCTREEARGVL